MKQLPIHVLVTVLVVFINNYAWTQKESVYENELINEKSVYLRQHAHNPINWMPWGSEALEKAKSENKLVIISIGYSSCHWCHVMEKETFMDEEVAQFMNKHFVNIKVDREERMDVDKRYMNAISLISKNTGWPLNCFALPDGSPFYGGTYYSKKDWLNLIKAIEQKNQKNPKEFIELANKLQKGLKQNQPSILPEEKRDGSYQGFDSIISKLKTDLDKENGGVKSEDNKFPSSSHMSLMLRLSEQLKDTVVARYCMLTLDNMSKGGLYDQIGGGFARYTTDKRWRIPHFEKMLYVNAQLVQNYANAYRIFKNESYKVVAYQTIDWLKSEMLDTAGYFYASQDADNRHGEGTYYKWTRQEIKEALPNDYKWFMEYYTMNVNGYSENGEFVLIRSNSKVDFCTKKGWSIEELNNRVRQSNEILKDIRYKRDRPRTDKKMISSWNALLVKGLTDSYKAWGDSDHLALAEKAMFFILNNKNGERLRHSSDNDFVFLDDYSIVIDALIGLYEVTQKENYLEEALSLTEGAIQLFKTKESVLFNYSEVGVNDSFEDREIYDQSVPSSNAIMADNLLRLSIVFERKDLKRMAKEMILGLESIISAHPTSFSRWMEVVINFQLPFYEVVFAGKNTSELIHDWHKNYVPNTITLKSETSNIDLLKEKKDITTPTIFVCTSGVCKLPVYSILNALKQIE